MNQRKLTVVPGIGAHSADLLAKHGVDSVEALVRADMKTIAAIRGFGPRRALKLKLAAGALPKPTEVGAPGVAAAAKRVENSGSETSCVRRGKKKTKGKKKGKKNSKKEKRRRKGKKRK